jgi:glycosyltransferase involved in cell wall biosynthesis
MKPENSAGPIVHVITDLPAAGAQMMLFKVLSRLHEKPSRHAVIALIPGGALVERIRALGIPVYFLGMKAGVPSPAALVRLIRLFRRLRPSLIQGWMYHANLIALVAASFLPGKVPLLWNVRHAIHDLAYEKRLTVWVIRLSAMLSNKPVRILYNAHTAATQHENLGFCPQKREVIGNGFETEQFVPSREARQALRQELGLPADAAVIGLIGRYHPMKDHPNFVRAAHKLLESHSEAHFVLAGKNVDAGNDALTGQINGSPGHFHLLGERQDVPRLMAGLDILASSSYGEGFPNVVGEAMSCGVPCVVTDVGDSGWVVGDSGLVVPPKDASELAGAWRNLIDMGREGREEWGQRARKRIVSQFSIDRIAGQYGALYSGLLRETPEATS